MENKDNIKKVYDRQNKRFIEVPSDVYNKIDRIVHLLNNYIRGYMNENIAIEYNRTGKVPTCLRVEMKVIPTLEMKVKGKRLKRDKEFREFDTYAELKFRNLYNGIDIDNQTDRNIIN